MAGRLVSVLAVPLLLGLAQPAEVVAGTEGSSRTYLRSWESTDGKNHVPLYEFLDLQSSFGKDGSFSVHFGGWGRLDLGAETSGDTTRDELQYGYLAWRGATGNRVVRLGRVEATGGVARVERLDGLSIGGDLAAGIAATGYAGVPVETDDDGRGGDLLFGGRLSHRIPGFSEIGVSYLKERNDGEDTREEAGVDVFLRPHRMVTLDGRSIYNQEGSDWMEHQYRAVLAPIPPLTLTAEYQKVDYRSFFRSSDASAFLPASLAGEEGMRLLGAEAAYALTPAVTATVFWRGYAYEVAGNANSGGARLGYARGNLGAGLAYSRVSGDLPSLRYHEYRGYAVRRAGRTDVSLDVSAQRYDEEIDGSDTGTTATLAVGYGLRPALRVAVDGTYTADPTYSSDVRGMLKLVYGFSIEGVKTQGVAP